MTVSVSFTRRLWISALCAVPLVILVMGPMVGLPIREWLGDRIAIWIELALATPVVLWATLPFDRVGADTMLARIVDMVASAQRYPGCLGADHRLSVCSLP